YDLYTRLTTEFPNILFESCASGGARFDPAMLAFAPQTWTSDDTDASERMKIQYGTSYVYPIVSMGSHVSAVPNHQMYRMTPIATRANVAYFGTFGYELDLNLLGEDEMKQVVSQIEFMKKYRELIQMDGDFYRLVNPFEGNDTAWMVVSQDKSEAVAAFYQRMNKVNASWLRLKLEGLDPEALYEVDYYSGRPDAGVVEVMKAYGDELMYAGIVIDREELNKNGGDFGSVLYTLKKA
ncbi:MAG: alpha-galactosidase, partial [Clostridia bacterium]|nr:alpha-galactosidase [Clostridia bacterium]